MIQIIVRGPPAYTSRLVGQHRMLFLLQCLSVVLFIQPVDAVTGSKHVLILPGKVGLFYTLTCTTYLERLTQT